MSVIPYPGFIGQPYALDSPKLGVEECINLYPSQVEVNGINVMGLVGTPGKQLFCSLNDPPVRGLYAPEGGNRLFAAGLGTLYEILAGAGGAPPTVKTLGAIQKAVTPVRMYGNGNSIFATSGNQGYLANGLSVQPVVSGVMGGYLGGYYIAMQQSSQNIQLSDLFNGGSWPGLLIAGKTSTPDNLAAIAVDHGLLAMLGWGNIEWWWNAGNAPPLFPFSKIQGSDMQQGCQAPWSVASQDNSLFWLAGDSRGTAEVVRANGFQVQRVSSHAVETAIRGYSQISDAIGSAYSDAGRPFYQLSFPTADVTWVYDCSMKMWHKRGWWGARGKAIPSFHEDLGRYHAYVPLAGGTPQHYVGDYSSGNIYIQSPTVYQDNGATIRRVRRAPHLDNQLNWTFYKRFIVDMQVGGALGSYLDDLRKTGGTPQCMMRYSNDGGMTWSKEMWTSIGAIGQYSNRVMWKRLGKSRDRVYEVVITDPIQVAMVDAYLDAEAGSR